jgi:hypothetical protein
VCFFHDAFHVLVECNAYVVHCRLHGNNPTDVFNTVVSKRCRWDDDVVQNSPFSIIREQSTHAAIREGLPFGNHLCFLLEHGDELRVSTCSLCFLGAPSGKIPSAVITTCSVKTS